MPELRKVSHYLKQVFPNWLDRYSEIQKQAVMHGNGPLLVSAGPGSGKTHVLTGRIIYLLQIRKVNPEKVVVITYTKEAALSMEKRFHKMISDLQGSADGVSFSTFHSLFYRILKSNQAYQNYQIISDISQRKLIHYILEEQVFPDYPYWNTPSVSVMTEQVKSAISFYKNTMEQEKYISMLPDDFTEKGREILRCYQKVLQERKLFDMDDLLYVTYEVLKENKAFLNRWQERFAHCLVDEFQDCNPLQYEILKLLTEKAESVFAVGDEDQAIYGFRGAKPGIMSAFQKDYAGCKTLCLGENYRSVSKIVACADLVIRESSHRQEKKLVSMVNDKNGLQEAVECHVFQDRAAQWEWIYKDLMQTDREKLKENCILFRTNLLLQAFVTGLRRNGIPFFTKEKGKCIYEHSVYLDVMAYLQVAAGNRERGLFLRILRSPFIGVGREALSEEQVSLEQVKKFYQRGAYQNEQTVENIDRLQSHLERLSHFSLPLAVHYIRKALRYEDWLMNKQKGRQELREENMFVLEQLQTEAGNYPDLEAWLKAQREYKRLFEEMKTVRKSTGEGVQVMTLHGAKGLEFAKVFLPDLNDGILPKTEKNKVNSLSEEALEEERRLFYVGITRAKEKLVLSYVTGTQQKPSIPSRFLAILFHKKMIQKQDYSSSSFANSSNS